MTSITKMHGTMNIKYSNMFQNLEGHFQEYNGYISAT